MPQEGPTTFPEFPVCPDKICAVSCSLKKLVKKHVKIPIKKSSYYNGLQNLKMSQNVLKYQTIIQFLENRNFRDMKCKGII